MNEEERRAFYGQVVYFRKEGSRRAAFGGPYYRFAGVLAPGALVTLTRVTDYMVGSQFRWRRYPRAKPFTVQVVTCDAPLGDMIVRTLIGRPL